jgi:hypothetical protein
VVSYTLRKLCPLYTLNERLGGLLSQFVCGGEEKTTASTGNRTPVVQSVASCFSDGVVPDQKLTRKKSLNFK